MARRHRWWILALLAMTALHAGEADTAKESGDSAPKPDIPDQRATLRNWSWVKDEKESVIRISLVVSWPKAVVHSEWLGQGTFKVTVPNTALSPKSQRSVVIAEKPVADVLFAPAGDDLEVQVRLNTPSKCRAYVVPSQHKVVIEADFPTDTPAPATKDDKDKDKSDPFKAKITAEFVDTDLRTIVEALVEQSGANIMLQPDVTGTYSLSLKDVQLDEALDSLWEAWSLCWMRLRGDIVLVGTEADLGKRAVEELLPLPSGWSVADVAAVLASEFPEVTLARDAASLAKEGPVPVRGPLEFVGKARRWVAKLPSKPEGSAPVTVLPGRERQETAVVFLRYLKNDAAEAKIKDVYPTLAVTVEKETGKIILKGTREMVTSAKAFLEKLDAQEVQTVPFYPQYVKLEVCEAKAKENYPQVTVTQEANLNRVVLRGLEEVVAEALKYLQSIDQPQRDTTRFYPRNLKLDEAVKKAQEIFPTLTVLAEADLGRLTLAGPRDMVASALKYLQSVDVNSDPVIEEYLFFANTKEADLKALIPVEVTIVKVTPTQKGVYARVRGKESLIAPLKRFASQLQDDARADGTDKVGINGH